MGRYVLISHHSGAYKFVLLSKRAKLENLDGCSQILSSCGVPSQRWLHISNRSQASNKLFRGAGVIHSVGHGLSFGCAQADSHKPDVHLLREDPERLASLVSPRDERSPGALQLTVFLGKKNPT